jgi:hypothetical protein
VSGWNPHAFDAAWQRFGLRRQRQRFAEHSSIVRILADLRGPPYRGPPYRSLSA